MELREEDLPVIQDVLGRDEYAELRALILCVRAARKVGLDYPVQEARQLENFLLEIGHDVAWLEERFAEFLPVQDEDDFIVKARVAAHQVLTLERHRIRAAKE